MTYEFEGSTEKEAIENAASELGLEKEDFDIEILEAQRKGLFKKGLVRIRVHTEKPVASVPGNRDEGEPEKRPARPPRPKPEGIECEPTEFDKKIADFVEELLRKMDCPGTVSVMFREEEKLALKIDSEHSSILIGKKGKNIDALQMLANAYARQLGHRFIRVILDSENYRIRREESLVRLAYSVADKVGAKRTSVLLEPMNPFDRRLIHTTLNDITHVETKSEGEGLYKRVRVSYRGAGSGRGLDR
jgi:spoIIIJ-associated protein